MTGGHADALPGLLPAQNGSIGEARTRAFLLDRFWVLERSVDIHGADFLIQRRLTDRTVLDRQRLGIVQSKYVQDARTRISIPEHYVCGDDGEPRGEFFLLVSTGVEDAEELHLLTAAEIVADLPLEDGRFTARAGTILQTQNRRIRSRRLALDGMERSMRLTGLADNRRYLAARGFVGPEADHVDADLVEPFLNWYGSVADEFLRAKRAAARVLDDAQEVEDALERMIRTTDPVELFRIYETELQDHVDGDGRVVVGSTGEIADEDLWRVSQQIRAYRERLRERGLLTAMPALLGLVATQVGEWVRRSVGDPPFPAVHVRLELDPQDLEVRNLSVRGDVVRCVGAPFTPASARRADSRVSILSPGGGVIEVCHEGPTASAPSVLAPSQFYPHVVGAVVQTLVHREVFGDDDGLL